MKIFTMFLLIVAFFCFPNFSNASIPSTEEVMHSMIYEQVDQAQETMEWLFQQQKCYFNNVQDGEDLYYRIIKELIALQECADMLDESIPAINIYASSIPDESIRKLKSIAKIENRLSVKLIEVYADETVGYYIPVEMFNEFSDEEWKIASQEIGFKDSKHEFLSKAIRAYIYQFTLIQ